MTSIKSTAFSRISLSAAKNGARKEPGFATFPICLMFQRLIGKVAKPGFFRAPFFAALHEILEKAVLFVDFMGLP